jgi:hypothetical protein
MSWKDVDVWEQPEEEVDQARLAEQLVRNLDPLSPCHEVSDQSARTGGLTPEKDDAKDDLRRYIGGQFRLSPRARSMVLR